MKMKMVTAPILGFLVIIGVLTPSILAGPYRNSLKSGENLKALEALSYKNFLFIMQPNCNLVLYHDSTAVWSTKTGGKDFGCYATLHSGGRLVVYSPKAVALWQSSNGTTGGEYVLLLQKNGNAVIYGTAKWWVVWPRFNLVAPNTTTSPLEGKEEATLSPSEDKEEATLLPAMPEPTNVPYTWEIQKTAESLTWDNNVLYTWETLKTGESLTWETYRCTMQTDCNFACWNSTSFIWSTSTSGKGSGCYLKFNWGGSFNIYNSAHALVWQLPFRWEIGRYVLILQKKPIIGIYGPERWSTRHFTAQLSNQKIAMVTGK